MLLFTSLFANGGFAQPGGEPGGEGSIALVNGGFETGDFTGWTLINGSGWQVASAGTTGNSNPRTDSILRKGGRQRRRGSLGARRSTSVASRLHHGRDRCRYPLTLNFTGWIGGEDGVNDRGRIRVNYLDGSMTLIDTTDTSTTIAAAGVYVQHTIGENIPSGTRFLQLDRSSGAMRAARPCHSETTLRPVSTTRRRWVGKGG